MLKLTIVKSISINKRATKHSLAQPSNDLAVFSPSNVGGVLKSMLASDVAIIDVKEHHIKHFEVIIELLRETTGFSNRSS